MRYRLRTLLLLLAVGPPLIAGIFLYPIACGFLGVLATFTCAGIALGRVFGEALAGGILAIATAVLLALLLPAVHGSRASPVMATRITVRFFNEAIIAYRDHVGSYRRTWQRY